MSSDLENSIFDILVDHADQPVPYQTLYHRLRQTCRLSQTKSSVDLFMETVTAMPSHFTGGSVKRVYVNDQYSDQLQPALVFTDFDFHEYTDKLYSDYDSYQTDLRGIYYDALPTGGDEDYLDFFLNTTAQLPPQYHDHRKRHFFELVTHGKTSLVEKFLERFPEAVDWRNSKNETAFDVAVDHDRGAIIDLLATAKLHDELSRKSDEALYYRDELSKMKSNLIWRTAEGVMGAIFFGLTGYFIGQYAGC